MSNRPEGAFTLEDVAHYCGVPLQTAKGWLQRGRLVAATDSPVTLVNSAELLEFMQQNDFAIPVELLAPKIIQPQNQIPKVLVVDEDKPAATMTERVLRNMGLDVIQANNAFDAGVAYIRRKPQLMALDLNLEGMGGVELIDNIRSTQTHRAKILVLTNSMPSMMAKAKTVGADAILPKPYDNDSLRRVVRILLGLKDV
jgi:CheY-like chemotaxis protein